MNQKDQIITFSKNILSTLKKLGASDAELYFSHAEIHRAEVREGELELAENAVGASVAVKAYDGQKSASIEFSYDEGLDLSRDLEELVIAAKHSPEDPFSGLASPEELHEATPRDFDQFDDSPLLSVADLQKRAIALEKSGAGDGIIVDAAQVSHANGAHFYIASNGFESFKPWSQIGQGIVCLHPGETMTRDSASAQRIFVDDLEDVEVTGKRAFERTWAARDPRRGPSGKFPILFDERVSSSLIDHLLGAMNAASIARRASWMIDYEEPIFPAEWALWETPFRNRRLSSSIYDAEGMVKKEQKLVASGKPEFWISNLYYARQLEQNSSGHAVRSGVATGASVTSLRLEAPQTARDALIKEMGEGLLVTGFIGATLNAHTGDYSRGAHGFWIKDGEIGEAVNEITIASNLKSMLPKMRAADDADEDRNYVVPSLLVEEMTIAGA